MIPHGIEPVAFLAQRAIKIAPKEIHAARKESDSVDSIEPSFNSSGCSTTNSCTPSYYERSRDVFIQHIICSCGKVLRPDPA